MSARKYILSARERNINKNIDYLPQISQTKSNYRSGKELPALSANPNNFVNRNLIYNYKISQYADSLERASTPFSDFFSESETGTPDFHSEESDSSSGSALQRNNAEASRSLAEEWSRIERTLYDEDGDKCNRIHMLEECEQWKQLHPHLRIVGKAIPLPEKRLCYRQIEHEEVIAIHYSDYEQFSESEERLSQSSTDVTPQNSPRVSITEEIFSPKLSREKVTFKIENLDLPDTFHSLLHITPIQIRSPSHKKRNPSILRSDLASSRWMRNTRPGSSMNCDRNSAKSFVSLDTRNYNSIVLDNSKVLNARVLTARHRELAKLEPLYTPEYPPNEGPKCNNGMQSQFNNRKVSLPPLLLEEEKKKSSINSARKFRSRRMSKGHFDKVKYG